jgi:hypothetical protein
MLVQNVSILFPHETQGYLVIHHLHCHACLFVPPSSFVPAAALSPFDGSFRAACEPDVP